MVKRGVSMVLLSGVSLTACGSADQPVPSGTARERHALAAFRSWLHDRTTARVTSSSLTSTPASSRQEYSGVLDFRNRKGRLTGTYSFADISGETVTDPVDKIFRGGDDYEAIPVRQRSASGGKQ
jgi:major membrane immunogen (membrane-anchored lipoprotein)